MLTSVKRLKEVYYREGLRKQAEQQVLSPMTQWCLISESVFLKIQL